jgi:hypothetical protein
MAVGDAQKVATHAWNVSPQDRFTSELIKAGDGVVRRRP